MEEDHDDDEECSEREQDARTEFAGVEEHLDCFLFNDTLAIHPEGISRERFLRVRNRRSDVLRVLGDEM